MKTNFFKNSIIIFVLFLSIYSSTKLYFISANNIFSTKSTEIALNSTHPDVNEKKYFKSHEAVKIVITYIVSTIIISD
jgi:hypothetical protein